MNTLGGKFAVALACLAGGLACAGNALAQSAAPAANPEGSGLRFNGFGTIGLTHTAGPEGLGFRRDISQPPNDGGTRGDIDSRLGLQLNYAASPRLEFVGQVLLKRRVDISPPIDSLEWAFAAYRPNSEWTIRVGRTNPDSFLLSDYRNVGFAYPWVRPEVGFYGALPLYSLDGADITHSWSLGSARWKLKLFAGQGAAYGVQSSAVPPVKVDARSISGLNLSREADGLTLRATVSHMRLALTRAESLQRLSDALQLVQGLPEPEVAAQARTLQRGLSLQPGELTFVEFGVSYEGRDWLLSGEVSNIGGSFAASHGTAGYASIGRRFGAVTLFGVLAASRSSGADAVPPGWAARLAPVLGPALAQQLQQIGNGAAAAVNAPRQRQQSLSLGMRWDIDDRMALKLQWDHYRISAHGGRLWSNPSPEAMRTNVGSLVLDFVF